MDAEETKACANCKREIPAVNFTIHSVHCARNIKVCPVCKEPVPSSELDDHHKKMHKLLPCKQCGESVCGTDLEDHVRDSCAHTVKSCRFCELELPRRELPVHEGYCGVRTEQCPDCKEYVMIKYQQLHQDSNHGFIRLDDDPPPPNKEPPKVNLNRPQPKFARNFPPNDSFNRPTSLFDDSSRSINRPANSGLSDNPVQPSSSNSSPSKIQSNSSPNKVQALTGPSSSGIRPSVLRPTKEPTNRPSSSNARPDSSTARPDSSSARPDSSTVRPDSSSVRPDSSSVRPDTTRPSANGPTLNFKADSRPNSTNVSISTRPANSVANLGIGNGSCDKPGPSNTRPFNSDISGSVISNNIRNNTKNDEGSQLRNVALNGTEASAGARTPSNGVKKRTNDQPQINMDTSATKTVDKDLGAVSRGAVKKRPAPQPPKSSRRDQPYYSAMARQQREDRERREQNEYNLAHGLPPVLNPAQKIEKLRKMDALHNLEFEELPSRQRRPPERQAFAPVHQVGRAQAADEARHEFKNLKPMSPTQFMRRFSSMQVSPPASDRFPEIRSSLRELRRGLNEVTAPYNSQNNNALNNNNDRPPSPADNEVQLPCEFCNVLVPAEDLVQHQTGCRPDLAQFVPRAVPYASRSPEAPESPETPESPAGPVIPCEFCDRHLPLYLIIEHQEQCIRENMPV